MTSSDPLPLSLLITSCSSPVPLPLTLHVLRPISFAAWGGYRKVLLFSAPLHITLATLTYRRQNPSLHVRHSCELASINALQGLSRQSFTHDPLFMIPSKT